MQNNKNMWIGLMILAVIVIVLVLLKDKIDFSLGNKGYSVVYLSTGEVYVGHLSTFSGLELKDSYILQVAKDTTDPAKNNFQLQPISQALWAPKSLHLTQKNIIFYGPLLPTSKIAETIAGQK